MPPASTTDGVLKDRSTYEVMQPERVGVPGNSLVLGKLSGRAGLQSRLEALGYSLDRDALNGVFESFKALWQTKSLRSPTVTWKS